MWKPACSVSEYFPRRSTTQACCCGTTRAILETRMIAKIAKTNVTRTGPIEFPFFGRSGPDEKHQTFDALNGGALPASQFCFANVSRVPHAAAHLSFAQPGWRQIVDENCLLADHRVDDFRDA